MNVDFNTFISITEANQNFSKVVRMVEKNGVEIILRNNIPSYIMADIKRIERFFRTPHGKANINVDFSTFISITEANQNFSKIVRLIENNNIAIILRNNVPSFIMASLKKVEEISKTTNGDAFEAIAKLVDENAVAK